VPDEAGSYPRRRDFALCRRLVDPYRHPSWRIRTCARWDSRGRRCCGIVPWPHYHRCATAVGAGYSPCGAGICATGYFGGRIHHRGRSRTADAPGYYLPCCPAGGACPGFRHRHEDVALLIPVPCLAHFIVLFVNSDFVHRARKLPIVQGTTRMPSITGDS
jgi:hypothetical protein